MQRKALGKGLSALIPDKPAVVKEVENRGIRNIPVDQILPNPHQPRKNFDPEAMADLERSIRKRGVIQPILVREGKHGFELIAGERRWRAAKQAGIMAIPAILQDVSDQDSLEIALIENLQREDLNPLDSAEAYERLIKEFHLTQEEISLQVGKQRPTITNILRLLSLPPELKAYVKQDKLTMGHAKAILSLGKKPQQISLGREIIRKGLSVRQAEQMAQKINAGLRETAPSARKKEIHLSAVEDELKRSLGTKVQILDRKEKGKIVIEYYSKTERERLISMLRGSVQT
ncbi:MAG: ParB/RepB/Spo0J family partition protein [bacterium]